MKLKLFFILFIILILFENVIFAQWEKVFNPGSRVMAIKNLDNRIYIGTENTGAWLSKDSGSTWKKLSVENLIGSYDIIDFISNGESVWLGSRGGNVIYSKDGENLWEMLENGFETQAYISKLVLVGDTIFAANSTDIGLQPSGIYNTSIDSIKWKLSGNGYPSSIYSISSLIITKTNKMYAGNQFAGIKGNLFVSDDYGKNWYPKLIENNVEVNCLTTSGDFIYAGTSNGIYVTTDKDSTWQVLGQYLPNYYVDDVVIFNNTIYAAIDNIGVLYSSDEGNTWHNISGNLPLDEEFIGRITIIDNYLYAGLGAKNGLWNLNLNLTDIRDGEQNSAEFDLRQNYPNPFNPSTLIKYSVPVESKVRIKIFDSIGREINTIVNEIKQPGNYSEYFNGSKLSSGVYYYKIEAVNNFWAGQSFIQTKKMILMK